MPYRLVDTKLRSFRFQSTRNVLMLPGVRETVRLKMERLGGDPKNAL